MYQIHSYVSNKKATYVGKVSGLLLYAKTDEEITPNQKFTISGNQFAVQTLDLNEKFSDIEKQLHDIVKFFSINSFIFNLKPVPRFVNQIL